MFKRIEKLDPAPPWSAFGAMLTLIGMFMAMILGSAIGQITFEDNTTLALMLGWCIGSVVTIGIVINTRQRTAEDKKALQLIDSQTPLPIVLLLSLGMAITIDLILLGVTGDFFPTTELFSFFDTPVSGETLIPLDVGIVEWILAFLFMVLLQPIAEGLVLRGVVYPALRATLGAWIGFITVILLHSLFHLLAYAPQELDIWHGFVAPLLVGLMVTYIRASTGSTRASIIAQAGFGLFALLKAFSIAS